MGVESKHTRDSNGSHTGGCERAAGGARQRDFGSLFPFAVALQIDRCSEPPAGHKTEESALGRGNTTTYALSVPVVALVVDTADTTAWPVV